MTWELDQSELLNTNHKSWVGLGLFFKKIKILSQLYPENRVTTQPNTTLLLDCYQDLEYLFVIDVNNTLWFVNVLYLSFTRF